MSAGQILVLLLLPAVFFLGSRLWPEGTDEEPNKSSSGSGGESDAGESKILRGQIEYLQGQIEALEAQNRSLREDNSATPTGRARGADASNTPTDPDPTPDSQRVIETAVELRGLDPSVLDEVVIEEIDSHDFRLAVRDQLVGDPRANWVDRASVWGAMGLIPDKTDLLGCFEDMILETSPFLVPALGEDPLFNPDGPRPKPGSAAVILATDSLNRPVLWTRPDGLTDDQWFGQLAIRLGEGAFVDLLDAVSRPAGAGSTETQSGAGMEFYRAPVAVRELFGALRARGSRFIESKHLNGGFASVDEMYTEANEVGVPTTYIMHPPKEASETSTGWGIPEPPALSEAVEVNQIKPFWHGDWGELLTILLLKQFLPESLAIEASEGWVGDTVSAYRDAENTHLIWRTRWVSQSDAEEFFKAMRKFQANRFGFEIDAGYVEQEQAGHFTTSVADGRFLDIRYTADRSGVIVIDAGSETWREALRALPSQ